MSETTDDHPTTDDDLPRCDATSMGARCGQVMNHVGPHLFDHRHPTTTDDRCPTCGSGRLHRLSLYDGYGNATGRCADEWHDRFAAARIRELEAEVASLNDDFATCWEALQEEGAENLRLTTLGNALADALRDHGWSDDPTINAWENR